MLPTAAATTAVAAATTAVAAATTVAVAATTVAATAVVAATTVEAVTTTVEAAVMITAIAGTSSWYRIPTAFLDWSPRRSSDPTLLPVQVRVLAPARREYGRQ